MDVTRNAEELATSLRLQLSTIEQLRLTEGRDEQVRLYRKALLFALLDSMSAIWITALSEPKVMSGNRLQFMEFVRLYGGWSAGALVSAPVLARHLKRSSLAGKLLDRVEERLAEFAPLDEDGGTYSLEQLDLPSVDLIELAVCKEERQAVSRSEHFSLLYTYRSSLVHEFRELDGGWDIVAERSGELACYF